MVSIYIFRINFVVIIMVGVVTNVNELMDC